MTDRFNMPLGVRLFDSRGIMCVSTNRSGTAVTARSRPTSEVSRVDDQEDTPFNNPPEGGGVWQFRSGEWHRIPSRPAVPAGAHLDFIPDDGGRAEAGYKGQTDDCVCRSVAIATGLPYQEVYDRINELATSERTGKRKKGKSSARTGVYKTTTRKLLESFGWEWHPTMQIGSGCTVHLRRDELPAGRLVVSVSKHITAVIDHTIHDTHDPSRDGTRCVYGYWTEPA